ncbi:MAG: recombinase zinc beta ribbon domain-containing protein, partial [Clostridiales bacterium]|nr:recombinase zinc beta ribbon domain-containing protein [Clostridiales bacterium]
LSVFAGFLKCADCGRAMQKRTVKQPYKLYDYYVCSTHKKLKSACTKHQIRADLLEAAVLEALNGYIALAVDFDEVLKKMSEEEKKSGAENRLQAELSAKRKELERAKKLLVDLYPDYKCGVVGKEQYFMLKEKYENAAVKLQAAIEEGEKELANRKNGAEGHNEFIDTFKKYRGLKALTREIVTEIIENIYIHEGGNIELCLKCKNELSYAEQYLKGREGLTHSATQG